MVWDATAYQVTIKALGSVETGMDYGLSAYDGSFSFGLIQWWGTRAAHLLFEIQSSDPTDFSADCPASIVADMSSHSATDSWWQDRGLTRNEQDDLRTLLTQPAVVTIQNSQIAQDIDAYLGSAARWGLDKDTQTEVVEFFCTVYNQSPVAAGQVVGSLPVNPTLHDIYVAALNNGIVGNYPNRQTEAYNIINTQDTSGVGTVTTPPPGDIGGSGNGDSNGVQGAGLSGAYITPSHNSFILTKKDGTRVFFSKRPGHDIHVLSQDNVGGTYPGGTPPVNTAPGGQSGPASAAATAIINWERSKLGAYAYSWGPARANPPVSGYCDCSSLQAYAFQTFANVSLGGIYVGAQWQSGTGTTISSDPVAIKAMSGLQPGDLIFFRWHPTTANSVATGGTYGYDHVGLFTGTSLISQKGHNTGYPNKYGPTEEPWDLQIDYAIGNGGAVLVRRYLT